MNKSSEKPVVAELGRPETTAETAARKAENSRLHRERQTPNNLILSLLASLGVVILLVLIVPRGVGDFESRSVDVVALAEQAEPTAGIELVAPQMPEGWLAKQAVIRHSKVDKVTNWFIAFTTPKTSTEPEAYASVVQAFTSDLQPANETWVAEHLERKLATGVETFEGHNFTIYDHSTDNPDETNVTYAMSTPLKDSMLIISGTASSAVLHELAAATLKSLGEAQQ